MTVQDGGYKRGGFWRISDRSGRKIRNYDTRTEWTGEVVGNDEYERRHPQDFVRGLADRQIVPKPRPPPQIEQFGGPLQTDLTADANAGDVNLSVISSARMQMGDTLTIPLSNGNLFYAIVNSILSETSIALTKPMPGNAAAGTVVTDYSAVSPANVG